MTEKAVHAAARIDTELTEANGGKPVPQRWVKVRQQMEEDPKLRKLIPALPKRLGTAVNRHRKERLIVGEKEPVQAGV